MATHAPDLFKNRSTTQEFLFSPSEDHRTETPETDGFPAADLSAPFPEMLDRTALIAAIETRMATAEAVLVLAMDIAAAPLSEVDAQEDAAMAGIAVLAQFCRTHGGIWGRIGCHRFACALAEQTADDGNSLARELLALCQDAGLPSVLLGWAVYPSLDDGRGETVENARKALDHGAFFGPGSATRFDAVSLNISGDRLYQAGDINGAMAEFKKGLRLDPADANLHNSLGVCYGVLEDFANAFEAFDNAMRLSPQDVMAVYNKGYLLLRQGRHEAALACFLEAHAREPEVFEVVYHIGQVYMETGQADQALPFLEAATRTNPRSGPAAGLLGRCLDNLGLTKEAIQAYKRAVRINPEDADALSSLGQLYSLRGESLDVAAVFCEQSVRLSPDNGRFRHCLGKVYLQLDRPDDALAEFEQAERLGFTSRSEIEAIQERRIAAKAS